LAADIFWHVKTWLAAQLVIEMDIGTDGTWDGRNAFPSSLWVSQHPNLSCTGMAR